MIATAPLNVARSISVYASTLFADAVGPFQTLVAEIGGQLAGVAQLDVDAGALRALFVNGASQGQGIGRALLVGRGSARPRGRVLAPSRSDVAERRRVLCAGGLSALGGPARLLSSGLRVPVTWMEKSLRP